MYHNNDIDSPSVGHSSHFSSKQERKHTDPRVAFAAKSAPRRLEQMKEQSAFSNALRLYKAQKSAFKQAETSLFSLFKSTKSKGKLLRKQTIDFREKLLGMGD